jgi:AbiV family abortive infection protein
MSKKSQYFKLTVREIEKGISLCMGNSLRLLNDAECLLNHGGSEGISYALWSLAVEEYGKGLLLKQGIKNQDEQNLVQVDCEWFGGKHQIKFETGYKNLHELHKSGFASVIKVLRNTNLSSIRTLTDTLRPEIEISVAPGITGEFEEIAPEIPPLEQKPKLRFRLIYVDWDNDKRSWLDPQGNLNAAALTAQSTIKREDIQTAIECLKKHIGYIEVRRTSFPIPAAETTKTEQ